MVMNRKFVYLIPIFGGAALQIFHEKCYNIVSAIDNFLDG